MSYAALFIGILVIVLLVIVGYHLLSNGGTADRTLIHDDAGKLIAIGDHERPFGQLNGRGTETSAPLQLTVGMYRIDYQFEALTRLALVDASGDDTLFIKSGAGTEALTIEETGRYRLLVAPNDAGAAWSVSYRWLGSSPTPDEQLEF